MAECMFAVLALLYFTIATKVDEWETITQLGFRTFTPENYLRNPQYYHYTSWAIFWFAAISCFWISIVPWTWGILVLLILFFVSGFIGHNKGINIYRQILVELLEAAKREDDEEMRAYILHDLQKSNSELLDNKRIASV